MPTSVHQPRTLYDKIWDDHVMYVLGVTPARTLGIDRRVIARLQRCRREWAGPDLRRPVCLDAALVCNLPCAYGGTRHSHLVFEVSSPQAFEGL